MDRKLCCSTYHPNGTLTCVAYKLRTFGAPEKKGRHYVQLALQCSVASATSRCRTLHAFIHVCFTFYVFAVAFWLTAALATCFFRKPPSHPAGCLQLSLSLQLPSHSKFQDPQGKEHRLPGRASDCHQEAAGLEDQASELGLYSVSSCSRVDLL